MRHGFSLIELSIVLVILGLLTGGILAGQSLIRAAELRSVTSDVVRYSTAIQTFRDKYFALPGDMRNATSFWQSAGGDGSNAACDALVSSSSPAVCNGNGDGAIEGNGAINFNERFYAWKELANAGLVEGTYQGRSNAGSGSPIIAPGIDTPRPKLSNTGYTFAYATAQYGNTEVYDGPYGFNTIYIQPANASGSRPFRPEEAWNIDTKLDDGKPAYGKLYVGKATGTYMPGCSTTDVASTAEYNLQNTNLLCGMWVAQR
jgi:prepilin-type N-terminal cleavage/methylation domain-containing protein